MRAAPTVLLPQAKDVRQVDLAAHLLDERIVFLGDQVNPSTANSIIQQLLLLERRDAKTPVKLYLNSPGGSVVDGLAIYDTIQRVACPVHCVVAGMAASMGAVILSGCCKGHRMIMKHGEVLLHQPLGGAEGVATDLQISARRILRMKERLLRLLAANCGKSYEQLVEDCDRDYWLDADEAKAYGIVDQVI